MMPLRCAVVVVSLWLAATTASVPAASSAAPSSTESCEDVTIVVDPGDLGGVPQVSCGTAGRAADLFDAAGHTLDFLPHLPGFVCRVDGMPASGPCFDGSSYWSLWWANPDGEWRYATLGVTALTVPDGGSVGFAWHQGSGDVTPPDATVTGGAGPYVETEAPLLRPSVLEQLLAYGALAALVLAAAAVPLLVRRRRR